MTGVVRVHVGATTGGTDAALNLTTAREVVTAAAEDGARLVVLPEYAAGFDPRGVGPELAEPLDGPFVGLLRELAARTGVAIVAGTTLPGEQAGRAVNAVVAVDGTGGLCGVYRKVHLYDAFGHRESERLEPGPADAAAVVLDVDGLRVGVMTCYDLRFPESARRLVDAGATVLAVPAAWAAGEHKADQWLTLLRARAIESTAYVLGSAQQGRGVVGDSVVVDPLGVVLAQAGARPGVVGAPPVAAAGLVPELVREVRERNPSLVNRRYAVVPIT